MICPVCKEILKPFKPDLVKCPKCKMLTYSGGECFIYDANYYANKSEPYGYVGYENDEFNIKKTFKQRLQLIPPRGERRLLDIGCATGFFLEVGREAGYDAEGLEICAWSAEQARNKGFLVYNQSIENTCFEQTYDLVTAWDVIEHVSDPQLFARQVNAALKPEGIFVFTTPDASSLVAKIMGKHWPNYKKAPEHQLFFTVDSVKRLLENNGFVIKWIKKEGKYISFEHFFTSLRDYTMAGIPIPSFNKHGSIYINPRDIMMVAAQKYREAS